MKKLLSILTLLLTMVQGAWADDKADYGVLNGEFSVSAVKKVHFSQGNLQAFYNSSESWEWRFAENQWDYVGNARGNTIINGNGSLSSREYAVDLFGWSTPAETNFYGINNSENNGVYSGNEFLDWSKVINFRSIFGEGWFTMSNSEWTYLLNSRTTTTTNMPTGTNSGTARYTKATVASEAGLILFPDNYAHPNDASVTVSSAAYNNNNSGFGTFTVNAENWAKMEAAGAVFLPAGGYRHGTGIIDAGSYGAYWSSTSTSSDKGTSRDFSSSTEEAYNTNRSTGCSVRLVIESHTITYNANGGEGEIASQPKYTDLDRTLSDGTGLTRSGYILDGWATTADGAKVYDLGATYTADADVTLYAHWTPVNNVTRDATMSEDWSVAPDNPVAAGAAVIATYGGTRHVKSVKMYITPAIINGKFTINDSGDKVYFSKGNLQLVGEKTWKFADNQWETFGENQSDNHRDLFGWCTVATPNKTSDNYEDYTSDTDWGDDPYLQACLGTGWHLITGGNNGKWNYLLNSRTTTSGIRYAVGSVNGKNGLILLPDDWNAEYYALNNTNKDNGPYGDNVISSKDWTEKLEAHGAVFLPAGGHRIGTDLFVVNDIGHYWCSTRQANGDVMRIDEELILPNYFLNLYYGCSIRLVRDVAE